MRRYFARRIILCNDISPVRSNQRDYFHVSSLREQADNVLRAWLGAHLVFANSDFNLTHRRQGTRWLSRWEKEIELTAKLVYYGMTVGRGVSSALLSNDFLTAVAFQRHRH